jgi:hypothetical protein
MSLQSAAIVTVGVQVERFDSKWIPLEYRMFWCKQQADGNLVDWAREEVGLLGVRKFPVDLVKRMQVGERRRYWVRMRMESHRDYWGEYDSCVEFLKVKRAR